MLQFALTVVALAVTGRALRQRWRRGLEWYQRLSAVFGRPVVLALVVMGREPMVVQGRLEGDRSGRRVVVHPDDGEPYRIPANRVASVLAGEVVVEPDTADRTIRALSAAFLLVLTPALIAVTAAKGGEWAGKLVVGEGAVTIFAIYELVDVFRD